MQISHREGEEGTAGGEISAEENGTGLNARQLQSLLEEPRQHVQRDDRLAHERQRRRQQFEPVGIARNREMTRATPRGHSQLRQVCGQPLLQLAGPARSDQGGPRRPATDVNHQARAIRLRPRAGERCGGGPRSIGGANRRDENNATPHRPAGLA